jgi:hypothetical protein
MVTFGDVRWPLGEFQPASVAGKSHDLAMVPRPNHNGPQTAMRLAAPHDEEKEPEPACWPTRLPRRESRPPAPANAVTGCRKPGLY